MRAPGHASGQKGPWLWVTRRCTMVDMPGMRARTGRGFPAAVAVCSALVLAAGLVTVVVQGGDPAAASTVLHGARVAHVVVDGRPVPAREGMVVPRGASVQTGPAGTARLVTNGRSVYLGPDATLTVLDGVRERLGRGQVMVDSRSGPRLLLGTDAGDVLTPPAALTRVERSAALRVGVFDGSAEVTPVGRSRAGVRVAELYQVQVPYGGLPQPTTALALRDDAWEQQLAADLVEADRYLNDLAGTLDGPDGAAVLAASPVVYRVSQLVTGAVTGAVTGSARVEQALGVALAQAAHRGGRDVQARLAAVQAARGSTGSWGVVAAIVDAPATDVGALLDRLRRPAPAAAPAPGGTAATAQALGTVLGLPGAAARAPGASTTGAVAAPALTLTGSDAQPQRPSPVAPGRPGSGRPSSGASNPAPSGPTNPSPASPAPGSPAPASPAPAPGVVQTVVDTVLGLVPQPPAPTTGRQVSARTGAARRLASR